MPARRLDQSFAVVEVADFPGMTVYVENQPVGRTDSKGRVLLDSLRAYERNAHQHRSDGAAARRLAGDARR